MKRASNRRYAGLWHLLAEQAIRWSTGCGVLFLSLLPFSLSDWTPVGEEPGGLTSPVSVRNMYLIREANQ